MTNPTKWIPCIFHTSRLDYRYDGRHYALLGLIALVGLVLRFWGLGNIGLHGDEKTMVLPALQILEHGLPYLPSGIMYPRGLGQLYLMASAAWLLGPSEWVFRLPSAVAGLAAIPIAFYLGKRFLPPYFNMVFVLIIAVFPEMITQSQTARMYIFLATFVMAFAVLVFRWEQRRTWLSLFLAVGCLLLALLFHQLAIFSAFLFFFPGLLHRSARLLVQGFIGFTVTVGAFLPFKEWIEWHYGDTWTLVSVQEEASLSGLQFLMGQYPWTLVVSVVVLFIALVSVFYRNRGNSKNILWSGGFLAAGTAACVALQYHIGALLLAVGAIVYARSKGTWTPLMALCIALAALFALHVLLLWQYPEAFHGLKDVFRSMNGQPSTWPYIKFASYFPIAAAVYLLILAYAVMRLVKGHTVPDHFLFFVLAVWLPVFCIGIFDWHIPRRFTYSFVALFLLCLIAGLHYAWSTIERADLKRSVYRVPAIVGLPLLLTINPLDLKEAVDRDYNSAPDHKGAGLFLKNRSLNPNDVVLAEDVLQQTYYFGDVDYWLRSVEDASGRVKEGDGELYNYMNNVPLIGSGNELSALLRRKDRGGIYVIGSGEKYYVERRSYYLGNGIADVLEKNAPEIIFRGRDGETVVMYFPPPARS